MSRLEERIRYLIASGQLPDLSAEQFELLRRLEQHGVLEHAGDPSRFLVDPGNAENAWLRKPVSPHEFLCDAYYAGEFAVPGRGLYAKLREDFATVFNTERPVSEVVFTGAIGNGKSYFVAWCMFYELYLLSCLRDPHRYCGIEVGTPIVLLNLSVTGTQARGSIYYYLDQLVRRSPYFRDNFPANPSVRTMLRFPKGIEYLSGNSSAFSAIGKNVVAGAVDEANFLVSASRSAHEKLVGEMSHALHLYLELSDRVLSRFLFAKSEAGFRGRIFIVSSALFADDFISAHVKKDEFRRWPDGDMLVLNYAHWEVRDQDLYDGQTFRVVVGTASAPSMLLPDDAVAPPDAEIVRVPKIYFPRFRSDVGTALRNIAGRTTFGLNLHFDPRWIDACLTGVDFDGYPIVQPDEFNDPNGVLFDDATVNRFVESLTVEVPIVENGRRVVVRRPRRAPSVPRAVHFDYALSNDTAGFAMSYIAGWSQVPPHGRVPLMVTEAVLWVVPPPGGQIRYETFRNLMYQLRDAGFVFCSVTFDQYQSVDTQQILEAHGFPVDALSVDKDLAPYESLRAYASENRWRGPANITLKRELKKLERVLDRGKIKIDHPAVDLGNPRAEKGSKDSADAVAATAWSLLKKAEMGGEPVPAVAFGRAKDDPSLSRFRPEDEWILPAHLRRPPDGR